MHASLLWQMSFMTSQASCGGRDASRLFAPSVLGEESRSSAYEDEGRTAEDQCLSRADDATSGHLGVGIILEMDVSTHLCKSSVTEACKKMEKNCACW